MDAYRATAAMRLDGWRDGFTRVIFRGPRGSLAIELPANMYRAVCGGPSCCGRTLADFAPLFRTGLVRLAPAGFADYFTRGRIVLGETAFGNSLPEREIDEWTAAQPAA